MLSVCMLVKNEARCLRRCLNSVKELAGEFIIVESGSTDSTVEICREYGAIVLEFDFSRIDFAAARNLALDRARGSWILVVDADETLDPESVDLIRQLTTKASLDGYYLERLNHGADPSKDTTDYVVRLFPNRREYRYRHRVHETVDDSIVRHGGRLLKSGARLQHEFASEFESRRRKNLRYVQVLKEEIEADPEDLTRLDFLAAEYHQLEMYKEAGEILEQLTRLRPDDSQTHLFAGTYHLFFKPDWAQARADLKEALRLRPQYPEAESFLRVLDEKERVRAVQAVGPVVTKEPAI